MSIDKRQAAEQLRADRDRIAAGAKHLRHLGAQGGYAGLRGEYTAYGLAAVLDQIAITLDRQPGQVRREALAAVGYMLDGPDGKNDPRATGPGTRYADGPGH